MANPSPRLAGRYAKSLMDFSISKNELESVYKDMLFLQRICKSNRDLVLMMKSPVIHATSKDKILDAIIGDQIGTITTTFNKLLIRKGREGYLPEIINSFVDQYKQYKGIYVVRLTTATPVSEELKESIVNKIKSTTSMKQIELKSEVREDIIGGFILEVGDHLVDASVAFDLHNVQQQFRNNDFVYKLR